jgi:hypothetical protein
VAVSYASPTYYADSLCDRGRMYIRNYCVRDDSDLEKHLDAEEKNRRKAMNARRDQDFKLNDKMSQQEKDKMLKDKKTKEKNDGERIENDLRDEVFKRVETDFYKLKGQGSRVNESVESEHRGHDVLEVSWRLGSITSFLFPFLFCYLFSLSALLLLLILLFFILCLLRL